MLGGKSRSLSTVCCTDMSSSIFSPPVVRTTFSSWLFIVPTRDKRRSTERLDSKAGKTPSDWGDIKSLVSLGLKVCDVPVKCHSSCWEAVCKLLTDCLAPDGQGARAAKVAAVSKGNRAAIRGQGWRECAWLGHVHQRMLELCVHLPVLDP